MSFLLRKITPNKWLNEDNPPFTSPDDFFSDPLGDLRTTRSCLSIFLVPSTTNVNTTVVGLAANLEKLSKFDYFLVKIADLEKEGFIIKESLGVTPLSKINKNHRDIVQLTAYSLTRLAKLLLDKSERGFVPKTEVKKLMLAAIAKGDIDKSNLRKSLLKDLGL